MINTPGPDGAPASSSTPQPDPAMPGATIPAGGPPLPRPAAPGARLARATVIVLAALGCVLVFVSVLWVVFVLALWALAGGDASPPGSAGPARGAPLTQVAVSGCDSHLSQPT